MVNRQTIRRKIFHLVLSGVLLFSLGAVVLSPQSASAAGEQALSFDGSNDYVNCGDDASLRIADAFTIEAWVKSNDYSIAYQTIGSKFGGNNGWWFTARENDLRFIIYDSVNGSGDMTRAASLVAGQYYYVAATFDGSDMRIYVNGSQIGPALARSYPIPTVPGYDARIGVRQLPEANYFNGIIDEVRISNIARTPAEIAASWDGGVGERFVLDDDTAGLWHMDEGSGGTIGDATTNNNDGTIYGPTWAAGFPFPSEAPPGEISKIVFTTPEQTLLVNQASEPMTIETQDAADNPTPVAGNGNITINLNSTSGGGNSRLSSTPGFLQAR